VLRGDLKTTPLADLLRSLAGAAATGCVYLLPEGQRFDALEATITLREGAICGVTLASTVDSLGTRLVATHQLTPDELAEAQLAQETELATWMLADLLIHLGLADEQQVHALAAEQALSDLTVLCSWKNGSWRFRRRARLGRNLPTPLPVDEALATVAMRTEAWHRLLPTILGADAVVSLAANDSDGSPPATPETPDTAVEMNPDAFVLLCTVDGTRTITDLANASGFTLLDAGILTAELVSAGLVQVTRDPSTAPLPGDVLEVDAPEATDASADTDEPADALAAAFSFDDDGPLLPENIAYGFSPTGSDWEPPSWQQSDRLADALARVSAALSEAMIEPPDVDADALAVEFIEPVPVETEQLEALSELVNELDDVSAEDAAEAEAFLEATVDEPFDDAFLESIEAVTAQEPPAAVAEPETVVDEALEAPEPAVVDEPEVELELELAPEPEPEPAAVAAEHVEAAIETSVQAPVEEPSVAAPVDQPPARPSGRSANAAEASRMLSQLAGDDFCEPGQSQDDEPEEEPEPAPEQHSAPSGVTPNPRRQTGPADTAALMRELSSLGAENGGSSGGGTSRSSIPRSAPAPTAAPGAGQKGKRKGLFGRN
jgi:hypothetical protein